MTTEIDRLRAENAKLRESLLRENIRMPCKDNEELDRLGRYAEAVRNTALEDAARVVEKLGRDEHPEYYAAAIRARKG